MPLKKETILSLDIGSTGVRAATYNANTGKRVSSIQSVSYEGAFSAGNRDVNTVKNAIIKCLSKIKNLNRVTLISHGSMAPSLVVYHQSNPEIIAHDDRRSTKEAQMLQSKMSPSMKKQVGNLPIPGGISCTSLKWKLNHLTAKQKQNIKWIGHLSTWFNFALTGTAALDYSHASFTGLYNVPQKQWVKPMLRTVGVNKNWLPPVHDATAIIGHVNKRAAKTFGLPVGAAVTPGVIDTSATIINTPMKSGTLIHSMGSTDVLALITDKPVNSDTCLTRHIGTETIGDAHYIAVVTLAAGGTLLDWTKDMLFPDISNKQYYRLIKKLMQGLIQGKVDSKGITFQPHIAGTRMQVEQPSAAFIGLSINHSREDLLTAVLAAYRDQMLNAYQTLAQIGKISKNIFMTGGASSVAPLLHADWPKRHEYVKLPEGNVDGLALIGIKALSSDNSSR